MITFTNRFFWNKHIKRGYFMGSYKPCTHPHLPTLDQKKVTLTHTHPHPVKKRSHSPTRTHIQTKKMPHSPTSTHTHPHSARKRSHPPTHNWKKECHVSNTWYICEKYSLVTILADVLIFEKDWPVNLFLLNTIETGFKSIVCLFVCFQKLANYISKKSKIKVINVWNIFSFFHYVLLLLYKIIKHIMHSSQSSKRDSENNTK